MTSMNAPPIDQLQALQLVSRAIEQARASKFDAFDETLERLEQRIQSLEPRLAFNQRQILEKLKTCYRKKDEILSNVDAPLQEGPFVIVVTPSFNGARFLDETITSVVSQRGEFALRYHVQDGGSTDGTVDILKAWELRLASGNPTGGAPIQFSWNSQKDGGMYDAIALGFETACSDVSVDAAHDTLMTWLNSDDM